MQYIILDMEWNQAWPGSSAARQPLPSPIRGEIVQIGAVRLTQDRQLADEFQILIRPKYFKKMNSKISKLTGIKDARLRAEGVPFPEAMARFRAWCGEDCVFLTWGFDDIAVLKENLALYAMDSDWVSRWCNAQLIFNVQTDGAMPQRALKTAMEMMSIEPSRPAHDALGDAYHTALICSRLDMKRGIAEYTHAMRAHADGFHGNPPEGCISRTVIHGYEDKDVAMNEVKKQETHCPQCGVKMKNGRWISQERQRYMTMAECPQHGRYLIRVRLNKETDGTLRVSRLVYEGASDAARKYDELAAARRPRRRRRRRSTANDVAKQRAERTGNA